MADRAVEVVESNNGSRMLKYCSISASSTVGRLFDPARFSVVPVASAPIRILYRIRIAGLIIGLVTEL